MATTISYPNVTSSDVLTTTESSYTGNLDLMYQMLQFVLMMFIVTGNVLVVLVIVQIKSLQTPPNVYVLFLAFSDILTGLSLAFSIVYFAFRDVWETNFYICYVRFISTILPTMNSIWLFLGKKSTF